ncbi:MAG: ATP-dependent DNA helicase RecG [Clostridia bacterium]|nr:ATP-dependent DNA helicase RecG [Clostridia bacterium]
MNILAEKVSIIKGVGKKHEDRLLKLNIRSVGDLISFYPRRLEDRRLVKKISNLADGETVCVNAAVSSPVSERKVRPGCTVYTVSVRDDSGILKLTFFNNRYLKTLLLLGQRYTFYGKAEICCGKRQMCAPEFERESENTLTKRILPVYPLTAGITQRFLVGIIAAALRIARECLCEFLPQEITAEYSLCDRLYAIENIHFPQDETAFEIARRRLAFEELFMLTIGLRSIKKRLSKGVGARFSDTDYSALPLPFTLTEAQKRTVDEIIHDLTCGIPMNRLVQGDVGSGKTAVAAIALYLASKNGFQGALMAPTEILAVQHFHSLTQLGLNAKLLVGSMSQKAKAQLIESLKSGETDIVVGTHALIEESVEFKNLAFIATDEQHRFGVRQRAALVSKGTAPHTLVMTATPIPRTMALIIYGDLDVSVIDTLPPGRQKVDTFCVNESYRNRVYEFIERECAAGHGCYIICPMVDENDELDLKAVTSYAHRLEKDIFPQLKVGLIHGKLKPKEKDACMEAFINGEIQVLVSTTVIEVGVNVPSATLMIVENAERFGLSQLHQLRGRVGRGSAKSYCILFCENPSGDVKERMEIMTKTNDGFAISQKDLEIRGPGEFFGKRQHGLPDLKLSPFLSDMSLLKEVAQASDLILESDPLLEQENHLPLKRTVTALFDASPEIMA